MPDNSRLLTSIICQQATSTSRAARPGNTTAQDHQRLRENKWSGDNLQEPTRATTAIPDDICACTPGPTWEVEGPEGGGALPAAAPEPSGGKESLEQSPPWPGLLMQEASAGNKLQVLGRGFKLLQTLIASRCQMQGKYILQLHDGL